MERGVTERAVLTSLLELNREYPNGYFAIRAIRRTIPEGVELDRSLNHDYGIHTMLRGLANEGLVLKIDLYQGSFKPVFGYAVNPERVAELETMVKS